VPLDDERCVRCDTVESGCLGIQLKMGGKVHLKLNSGNRPIANQYCEGKMKRTLKRELKGLEIAKREPFGTSVAGCDTAQWEFNHRCVLSNPAGQHGLCMRERCVAGRLCRPCPVWVSCRL